MKTTIKRKEIWSLGLYKESLRRIRIPAVIFFVIAVLSAIIVPLATVISRQQGIYTHVLTSLPKVKSASDVNPILPACVMIAAAALTFTLFSFLNKRNSSDFYCSMPHTRLAMYTSRITALITAIASIILIPTGVSAIMLTVFGKYFAAQWDTFFPYMVGCFAASMLICAVFAIAMSITGTILNNVAVAGLIMFLPRTVLTIIVYSVSSKFPLIVDGYISELLYPRINILTGFYDTAFILRDANISLLSASSQIYTLCLAVVYFIIGAVLFVKRKSESAERAAPTPFMQSVYRILITMVVCLIPCGLIFNNGITDGYDVFVIVCFYVAALLVYLFYELITTKKWKNLVKCLPGLVVVLILNLALLGTMYGIYAAEKSFSPDADDISYVCIQNDGNTHSFQSHVDSLLEEIKISDPEILETVSNALDRCVEFTDAYSIMPSTYNDAYGNSLFYKKRIVKFKLDGITKYRYLLFTHKELDQIESHIKSREEYKAAWLTLPEPNYDSMHFDDGNGATDHSKYELLFETLRNEVAALDVEYWRGYLNDPPADSVMVYYRHEDLYIAIPVSVWGLPESTAMIAEIRTENSLISPEEMYDILKNGKFGPSKDVSILSATYVRANGTIRDLSNTTVSLHDCVDTEAELNVKKGYLLFKVLKLNSDVKTESYVYLPINEKGIDRYKGDGNGIYGIK